MRTRSQRARAQGNPASWSRLDEDAALSVFAHLGHKELCRAATVCKEWRTRASLRSLWNALLHKRWPQLMATGVNLTTTDPCDMYRRMLPDARAQDTKPEDVVMMIELLDSAGQVLSRSTPCALDKLERREVDNGMESGMSDVITFPELLTDEDECIAAAVRRVCLCLLRRRDAKVVRVEARNKIMSGFRQSAYPTPLVDIRIFPSDAVANYIVRNTLNGHITHNRDVFEYVVQIYRVRGEGHRGQCTFELSESTAQYTDDPEFTDDDGEPVQYIAGYTRRNFTTELLSMLRWE